MTYVTVFCSSYLLPLVRRVIPQSLAVCGRNLRTQEVELGATRERPQVNGSRRSILARAATTFDIGGLSEYSSEYPTLPGVLPGILWGAGAEAE